MADIDSLNLSDIGEMSREESLELLRKIRLSRLTPKRRSKTTRMSGKSRSKKVPQVNADQAAELLKLLGGIKDD